jgi:drug/metabolite transporter (DMT)-like permease
MDSTPFPAAAPSRFSHFGSLLLALAVVVVWGISFAVTRATVTELPPLSLAFLRFLLASLVLWPLTRRLRREVRIARGDRMAVFLFGFVGVTLYFGFENFGLKYTTASHAALLIAIIPLATELADALRRRRPPSLPVLAGMLISTTGVALIFGRDGGGGASLLGDSLMLGAVAAWVWYTFLAEHLMHRYPNLLLTYWIMGVGSLTLLPGALLEYALAPFPSPSPAAWGGVAFLGIFCSALGYHFWNQAIPVLGVTASNNLLYGLPLVGVVTGILLLGEPLTPAIAGGAALILGGVLLAGRSAAPKN